MNKGFIAILVTITFFVAAALLMGMQQQTPQSASFKESFSQSELFLSNYEILLNQAAQDCNWSSTDANIKTCVETDSNHILGNGSAIRIIPPYTTCFTTAPNKSPGINTVSFDLNCTTNINTTKGTLFYNNFKKRITASKSP